MQSGTKMNDEADQITLKTAHQQSRPRSCQRRRLEGKSGDKIHNNYSITSLLAATVVPVQAASAGTISLRLYFVR